MAKTNSKIKPVHFNLNNPKDLELFNKANKISNFSKWVKDYLASDGIIKAEEKIDKESIKELVKEILYEHNKKEDVNIIQANNELDSMML